MSALSLRTMIATDRLPTHALPLAVFQEFLERGVCTECRDAENATARMEVWSYPDKSKWVYHLSVVSAPTV